MIGLLWFLAAWLGADPCSPSVEAPVVSVDQRSMEITIARTYGIPWAVCAQEKSGKAPVLRVTAKDDAGNHVLLEKPIELTSSLRDATAHFSATVAGCRDTVPNKRAATAVLQGPVGSRHWFNRRAVEVELVAAGPFAPLAFKTQTEVFCRACDDGDTVSFSYYINDFDKKTARMVVSLDKARYECAKGGGRMLLRRFWTEPGAEQWAPLQPYEVVDNLQERLRPDGDKMTYELVERLSHFCKAGKSNLFEVIGVDEYATIMRRNYGPSDAIHRSGIEFLQCK